ncbi:MAG: transposase [Armatimonadota bacterium]|nr:transposase [Armatimonadota bacterium]
MKTDRRDATKLARLLRSRELTPIWVPDEAHEALRDLTRAREDARHDLLRARHRLSKLLLRLGIFPPQGIAPWSQRHHTWLETVTLPHPARQVAFGEYRHRPSVWGALRRRQRGQPERIKTIAWHAQDRLHRRYRRLVRRGKRPQQAVVAVARELLGFIWAIARERQAKKSAT